MKYLADSVFLIELFRRNIKAVEKAKKLIDSDVKTSVITAAELYEGAYRANQTSRHLQQLSEMWNKFEPVPFQLHHAEEFGRLKSQFNNTSINDLLIASITLVDNYVLLTKNKDDFLPLGVQVEDW
jgi:tRNA(fMet)-specific endonuclease VapC